MNGARTRRVQERRTIAGIKPARVGYVSIDRSRGRGTRWRDAVAVGRIPVRARAQRSKREFIVESNPPGKVGRGARERKVSPGGVTRTRAKTTTGGAS